MLNRIKGTLLFMFVFTFGIPISVCDLIMSRNRLRTIFNIITSYELIITSLFVCLMTDEQYGKCSLKLQDYRKEHCVEYCIYCELYKPAYEMYSHYTDICNECIRCKMFYTIIDNEYNRW